MVRRLELLVGHEAGRVWAGTFHHIGNRLLRRSAGLLGYQSNFTILDSEDQLDLIRLAMDDAGLLGAGKLAPKPAAIHHMISYSANVNRPLAQIVAERGPDLVEWQSQIEAAAASYAARKLAANSLDYDDLLLQWGRLIREFPEERAAQARMFRHILIDEMQDTNAVQVAVIEGIAAAGAGNISAVGDDAQSIYRFRGADYDNILKFPERHPGGHGSSSSRSTTVRLPRSSRLRGPRSPATNRDFTRTWFLPVPTGAFPWSCPPPMHTRRPRSSASRSSKPATRAWCWARWRCSIAIITTASFCKAICWRKIPYTVRSGLRFFEQAHIKDVLAHLRIVLNPRDEASWRRVLLLLPGVGPAKAAAIFQHLSQSGQPLESLETAQAMALLPAKSKGFFAGFVNDLKQLRATDPENNPAAAVGAILKGGYASTVKLLYERPENRIADIEQFTLLAAKYESLGQLIADLLLAGDVYGMDSAESDEPGEVLVLSTVHQAKGLEWSHVFIPRLVEDSFPHRRALDEPGGEEEERRIFYVAVTRAMNELTLTYPLTMALGGRGPTVFTMPSRFLTEIDNSLVERAEIEAEIDLVDSRSGAFARAAAEAGTEILVRGMNGAAERLPHDESHDKSPGWRSAS